MTSIAVTTNATGTRFYRSSRDIQFEIRVRDRFQRIGIPCHVSFAGPLDSPFEPDPPCPVHSYGGQGRCSFCEDQ